MTLPTRTTAADLRRRWARQQPVQGVWSLLPGAVTAELLAGTGAGYVVLDLQHGALAESDLPAVTAAALDDLGAVLAVEGLDGIYVGPSDLSLSLGRAGDEHRDHMRTVIASIVTRAVAAGMPVGVHTSRGEVAAGYAAQGATIVTAAVDLTILADGVRHELAVSRPRDDRG